jgi:CubicO group peptidase (beta-lactamase class C family)
MSRASTAVVVLLLAGCGRPAAGPAPEPDLPGWAGVTRFLDSAVAAGVTPGAVLGVSVGGRHHYFGTGRLGLNDPTRPDSATLYDLASLTKVIGLTTITMLAVQEGRLALDTPVVRYVPAFAGPGKPAVTLRQLLTHSSGLPAWRPLYRETVTRAEAFALTDTTPLAGRPGGQFVYSDLGAIVLTQAVERAYGERLDTLLARRVFDPLGMGDTRYLPPPAWLPRIAPTEQDPWRGRMLRGEVHDENAARLDGVSGHAGLFSSARDLLRFADALLGAEVENRPGAPGGSTTDAACPPAARAPARFPAAASVVREFTRRQDIPPGSSRALGWDTPSEGSSAGTRLSAASFGHTGFTGTSIWMDPARCLAIVLLSNRVHPTRQNARFGPVRAMVADRVVQALSPKAPH